MGTTVSPTAQRPPVRRVFLAVLAVFAVAAGAALAGVVIGVLSNHDPRAVAASLVRIDVDLGGGVHRGSTGVVLRSSGEVITVGHTLTGAQRISVDVPRSGIAFGASLLALDPTDDVALLQLQDAPRLTPLATDDVRSGSVGDHVSAIGLAADGGTTVQSEGQITALGQNIVVDAADGAPAENYNGMIKVSATTAADPGAPVVDSGGAVVGVESFAGRHVRGISDPANTAFAVPMVRALAVALSVEAGKPLPSVAQGGLVGLGVQVHDSSSPRGAQVVATNAASSAQAAGIQPGDVIVSVGGSRIGSAADLVAAVHRHHAGDRVTVVWITLAGRQRSDTLLLEAGLL